MSPVVKAIIPVIRCLRTVVVLGLAGLFCYASINWLPYWVADYARPRSGEQLVWIMAEAMFVLVGTAIMIRVVGR